MADSTLRSAPAHSEVHVLEAHAPEIHPTCGENHYRQLIQGLPAAVYTTDVQGRVTMFNDAAVQLWGRTPSLGEEMWCGSYKIFKPDGSPMALDGCPMAVALREGRSIRGEEIIIERPDGTRRNVLPHPDPIFDSHGKVIGAINMLVDITDTKTAEKQRIESDRRLSSLVNVLPAGVYTCDAEGYIDFYNPRAAELWGCQPPPRERKFCGCHKVFLPDGTLVPADQTPMAAAVQTGKSFRDVEAIMQRPDGTSFVASVNIDPIRDEDGRLMGALNVFQDITPRTNAEQALRDAKEAAETANRSKDKFLAVLSHELRTPLMPVLMTVAALEVDADLPRNIRDDVAMIRRNVELETKLIDDLLDLSRITSGKIRLQPQSVDVNETVRHVCGICREQILEKGIHLHCDLDAKLGRVTADPARLQQILWNVLKNAAKFTSEGSDIYVSTSRENDRIRITLRDRGIGIEPDILPRIFDAFEQGDARITRQFGGLGLGLAISKALVELHSGTIRAESNGAGSGSTFTIDLPAETNTMTRSENESNDNGKPRTAALKLLVVEDHVDTARTLGRLLQASGYSVRTAGTVAGALDLATNEHFDLVLTDIGLPDATGYDLIQQIKSRNTNKHSIKCIAMSGYGMDEDLRKSKDAGFSDHLVKPLTLAQLMQSIQRVVGTNAV